MCKKHITRTYPFEFQEYLARQTGLVKSLSGRLPMFNRTHYWAIRHASVDPILTNEWAPERSLAVIYISHFVLVLSL